MPFSNPYRLVSIEAVQASMERSSRLAPPVNAGVENNHVDTVERAERGVRESLVVAQIPTSVGTPITS
jgi:hypothetical protein